MKDNDLYKMQDPLKEYYHDDFSKQEQKAPGLQSEMRPVPDCGEESYKGFNRLEGRKALVTGGDSGIGRACAIAFAREGADVAINYLPEEQSDAEEVAELIRKEGRKAVLLPGDLSDESFCRQMVRDTIEAFGGVDLISLNAGKQTAVADIEDLPSEQFRKTFETNVFSMYWTLKEALPHLKPGASIITCSSVVAYQPSKDLVDYSASKAAIIGFSRALAKQIAAKGIRLNVVAPGPIWTALQITGGQSQEKIPQFGHDTPLQRAGQPVELSGLYVFLASQESSYITAEVFGAAGGKHLA